MKFKVGDRIRYVEHHWSTVTGIITEIDEGNTVCPYKVKIDSDACYVTGKPVIAQYTITGTKTSEDSITLIEEPKELTDEEVADLYRKSLGIAREMYHLLRKRSFCIQGYETSSNVPIKITKTITTEISL